MTCKQLGISLAIVMVIGSTPLVFAEEIDPLKVLPNEKLSLPDYVDNFYGMFGFPLYGSDHRMSFINYDDLQNYENMVFSSIQNKLPQPQTLNSESSKVDSPKFSITLDKNSKLTNKDQQNLYLIQNLLRQTLSQEEIEKYSINFEVYTFDRSQFIIPEYVINRYSNDTNALDVIDPRLFELLPEMKEEIESSLEMYPSNNEVIIIPLNKISEFRNLLDNDDNIQKYEIRFYEQVWSHGSQTIDLKENSLLVGTYLPPLKQINNGILPQNVFCNDDKTLAFKVSDNSPLCIRDSSLERLTSMNIVKQVDFYE